MDKSIKQADNSIDILKFMFAICIVCIHTGIFSSEGFIPWFVLHWLCRLAVPFFFVTSGYYLGKKIWNTSRENSDAIFKDYRCRLFPPLFVWGGMGTIIYALLLYMHNTSIKNICIYVLQTIIFYPRGAMWFVWACIVAAYIIQVFWNHNKLKLLLILSFIGYLFALVANTYYFLIEDNYLASIVNQYMLYCISARNGVFYGTLFMLEGIFLANRKIVSFIDNIENWKIWLVYIVSDLFLILEVCFSYKKNVLDDSSLFLVFPILIPVIVILALRYRIDINLPYNRLRKLSTSIYFTHDFVLNIAKLFFVSCYIKFFIVILVTVVIGIIAQILNKPLINKFLL